MELTIEQPCPTCGAVVSLSEDDRLIRCEFCDVENYKIQHSISRYSLPAKIPPHISNSDIFYVPYLRFKGCIYYCQGEHLRHKLIDTTRIGANIDQFPVSLGLRPQAMRLLPVTRQLPGQYIRQNVKAQKIFAEAARLTSLFNTDRKNTITHRAFIGETISRIYFPVYTHNGSLFDGVNNYEIGSSAAAKQLISNVIAFSSEWEPRFLSTICPKCGDSMNGSAGTLVMNCENCETQWYEDGGRFKAVEYRVMPALYEKAKYIPFWCLEPEVDGCRLESLADFLKLTNQPVVAQEYHYRKKLSFIVPAFKVNPTIYLNTAKNLTILQSAFENTITQRLTNIYPVTLEHKEAVQSLKSVLAASALSYRLVRGVMESMTFNVETTKLIYLPFRNAGHDLIEHHTGMSIPAAALRFGRSL